MKLYDKMATEEFNRYYLDPKLNNNDVAFMPYILLSKEEYEEYEKEVKTGHKTLEEFLHEIYGIK